MSWCTCDDNDPAVELCPVHDVEGAQLDHICDVCSKAPERRPSRADLIAELRATGAYGLTVFDDGWQTVLHDRGDTQLCPVHELRAAELFHDATADTLPSPALSDWRAAESERMRSGR